MPLIVPDSPLIDPEQAERDSARLAEIARSDLGRECDRIEPIPAGLGTRRFHRLHFAAGEPRTLIARIEPSTDEARPALETKEASPPAWLDEPPLEPLRSFLESHRLPVPASALSLAQEGVELLEDVGETTLLDLPDGDRPGRYVEAARLIARLQALEAAPAEIPAFRRHYDDALVETKAWKWLHWTIPLLLGRGATAEEARAIRALFDHIAALARSAPHRLAHRDFKAENLHLVSSSRGSPSREGQIPARLVMIDVQGAFMAPPEYDLACLLYDLQVELPESLVQEVFRDALASLPDRPTAEVARERFDALAIARLCKDVSHVVHAGMRRGDPRRWHEIPRGLALLARIAGRREHTFPGARVLTSVIETLTAAFDSADSPKQGQTGSRESSAV